MPATKSDTQLLNETLFEQLATPGLEKQAVDAINDFTRERVREDGFWRKLIPMLPIQNSDLDRQYDTDLPVKIVDMEPDSPAALSLPFATLPTNYYIRGRRYRVQFDRILTPRFTKDVDELRTWVMDIRQVMSDNALKDMLAEEDAKFLLAVNTGLISQGAIVPCSGTAQWQRLNGGITRDTIQDAFNVLPSTPFSLAVHTCLVNHLTVREFLKWGRDEVGGDLSQDLLKNGWTEAEFMNARWIITLKRDLVPNNSIYMFADPKFIGKSYGLEDTTMFVKREAFMLEFFAYESIGGGIGHLGSISRIDFA